MDMHIDALTLLRGSKTAPRSGCRACYRVVSILAALSFVFGACIARADTISEWNTKAFDTFKAAKVGGNPQFRALAIMHVAMSDAVNTVQNRYTRYALTIPLDPSASAEAAAIAAARNVLLAMASSQKNRIDTDSAAALSRIPDGVAKVAGIAIGEQAAAAVMNERASDATDAPDTYRPITTPGVWIPTTAPIFAEYARARPWVFSRADQFRPGPPPSLNSARYARDYNETRELGGVKSTRRTAQQSEAVKFWAQPNFGEALYQAAGQLGAAQALNLADNARLYALLAMAAANSYVVDWDAKFYYNLWRPITAIRNGDIDGNDATERDAGWTPLNTTPMHPEYPSQAAIFTGVAAGIFEATVGAVTRMPITITDSVDPKITRQFDSLAALLEEMRLVRIWGGVHFRSSLDASDGMGREVASYLIANSIKPVR